MAADCMVVTAVATAGEAMAAAVAAAAAMLVGRAEPPEAVAKVGAAAQ
mgnify:CR=1 FL=1